MANVKIRDLTAAPSVSATDLVEITLDPSGAPASAKATIAQVSDAIFSEAIETVNIDGGTIDGVTIGTPSSGTLTNCTGLPVSTGVSGLGANVATFLATPSSANLAAAVTGETGTGALVFGTSPTFTTDITVNGGLNFTGTKSHWMGEVYVTDNATATTIANTTDFVKAAGATTIQNNMGFDSGSSSNRLRYTGTTTRMFHVASSFSLSVAGTNQTVQIAVFKNGIQVTGSLMELRAGTSGEVVSSAMHSVASLATNDYIEVYVRNTTSTASVTVKHLNFFAMNAN